jgi:DNA gyrase subunit A
MFFTNAGRVFRLTCYQLPEASRTARGTAIVNLMQLEGGEKVTATIPVEPTEETSYLTMVTRLGMIKKTGLTEFRNIRQNGLNAISLREGDELIKVCLTSGEDELLLGTRRGQCIRFHENPEHERGGLRPTGRTSMGVRAMDLQSGDEVVAMDIVDEEKKVLSITQNGFGKRTSLEEYRLQSRSGKGIKAMNLTDKTGPLAGQLLVADEEDVMLISDDGTVIRTAVSEISETGRLAQGVRLMRVGAGSRVVAIAPVARNEEEEDEAEETGEADDQAGVEAGSHAEEQGEGAPGDPAEE